MGHHCTRPLDLSTKKGAYCLSGNHGYLELEGRNHQLGGRLWSIEHFSYVWIALYDCMIYVCQQCELCSDVYAHDTHEF